MDLSDSDTVITLGCAIAIVVGLVGVVVPLLPGLLLCWAGVLVWALLVGEGGGRWVVLALATLFVALGTVVKYAWPARRLNQSGVPSRSLLAGGALGLVGFFVIPVVGLPLGFVAGVWAAESARLGGARTAWPSTWAALKATGLSVLIEFAAGLATVITWTIGVVTG